MKIRTSVAPSAREWAENKARELAGMTLEEIRALGYEEASGFDKADTIGMILAVDAPMTDEELHSSDYDAWDYTIELEDDDA